MGTVYTPPAPGEMPDSHAAGPPTAAPPTGEEAAARPTAAPPPIWTPPPAPPSGQPSRRQSGLVAGLILIGLGIAFLLGNLYGTYGGLPLIALGAAFLVARVVTGRYGFAVPGGILLGLGAFVALTETGYVVGQVSGGWFFILMGAGFVVTYIVGARPTTIWPLVVAIPLMAIGLVVTGWTALLPLRAYAWLGAYWPVTLVLLGVWLLVRRQVPESLHGAVGIVGALLFSAFIALAALASYEAAGPAALQPASFGAGPVLLPTINLMPYQETATLAAPLADGQSLRIDNPAGQTTIQAGSGDQVQVTAVKHAWSADRAPSVTLQPQGSTLLLEAVPGAGGGAADLTVTVPSTASVAVVSASGGVEAHDLAGTLSVQASSGGVWLQRVAGSASVVTGSGSVLAQDVSAELRIATGSGDVRGENLTHLRASGSGSGGQDLAGTFTEDATIQTGSGNVRVQLAPGSSARVDARSVSGSVRELGGTLSGRQSDSHSLTGSIGGGAGLVTVRTGSGNIALQVP